jgi:hypothetical protein
VVSLISDIVRNINTPTGLGQTISPTQTDMLFALSPDETEYRTWRDAITFEQDLPTTNAESFDPSIRVTHQGQEYTGFSTISEAEQLARELSGTEISITPNMHIEEPSKLIAQFENIGNNNIATDLANALDTPPASTGNIFENIFSPQGVISEAGGGKFTFEIPNASQSSDWIDEKITGPIANLLGEILY